MPTRTLTLSLLLLLLAAPLLLAQPIASLTLHGVDAERNDLDSLPVLIDEEITLRPVALHPVIYFSERGEMLQDRYRYAQIGPNEPLALRLNRRLLDTVAARMAAHPKEQLRLIASASNDAESRALASRRCDTVLAALVQRGVARERVESTTRINPPTSSSAAGRTVLRGVLLSGSPSLLGPMPTFDTVRTYTPTALRYRMGFNTESILRWKLNGTIDSKPYRLLVGEIAQTVLSDNIPSGEAERMAAAGEVGATFEVTLPDSSVYVTAPITIPVNTVVVSRKLSRFPADEPTAVDYLLLFPPDSSALSPATLEALDDLQRTIPEGSRVIVTGYTDSTEGSSAAARLALGVERARRVAEQLRSFKPVYDGFAASPENLPAGTPEGRAFARIVRLIVAPPQTAERR